MNKNTVMETCPHCESEIEMRWDTDKMGFKAFCPVCGNPIMLCGECRHTKTAGPCDYDSKTGACRQNTEIGKSMERLTRWFRGVPEYVGRFVGSIGDVDIACMHKSCHWRFVDKELEVLKRLAAYEDTGLTPREIAVLKRSVGGHLLELQRAEIENRLVILPVAPLGYLYEPARCGGEPAAIKSIARWIKAIVTQKGIHFIFHTESDIGWIRDIDSRSMEGKYFLTYEEAVEASRKQLEAQVTTSRPGGHEGAERSKV